MRVGRILSRVATRAFFLNFSRGGKYEIRFFPLKTKKTFFC